MAPSFNAAVSSGPIIDSGIFYSSDREIGGVDKYILPQVIRFTISRGQNTIATVNRTLIS